MTAACPECGLTTALRTRRPADSSGAISRHDQLFIYGIANGLTDSEIGDLTNLSPHQVRRRISTIITRVRARNRAHLVAIAAGRGQLWV